jgi:putative Holliday junction resolvase
VRYIAVDLGDKRTGLAVGDSVTRVVMPLDVIEVPIGVRDGAALAEALARVIEDHLGQAPPLQSSPPAARAPHPSPGELVVGLPLNMDGTEGPRAKIVRAFAARLGARTRRAVRFQDERLTSAAADWSMARSGLTRGEKKDRRDALAAAVILRDFLEAMARADPPSL